MTLALGEFEPVGSGRLRSKGIELYAIRSRYRSIEVVLEIDVADLRFRLLEQYPVERMFEMPIWDGLYEGRLLDSFRVMSSVRKDADAVCLPDLLLSAVVNLD